MTTFKARLAAIAKLAKRGEVTDIFVDWGGDDPESVARRAAFEAAHPDGFTLVIEWGDDPDDKAGEK
jgi:hypothetical protein